MKFITLSIIIITLMLSACQKDPNVHNLKKSKILGHAGSGKESKLVPNSFQSFDEALRIDIDGWELDIQLSKDSVPIVYKDNTLQELTNCEGMVKDYNASFICNCLYSDKSKVMTLRNFMEVYGSTGKDFLLDVKLFGGLYFNYALADSIALFQEKYSANILVGQNSDLFLTRIQEQNKNVKLFRYSKEDKSKEAIRATILTAYKNNYEGVYLWNVNIDRSDIEYAESLDLVFINGNVRSRSENRKAFSKFSDYIRTDYPIHLKELIEG